MVTTHLPSPRWWSVPAEPARRQASRRRTLHLLGHDYPILLPSIRDPRLHVAVVLLTLQVLGQTVLDFRLSVAQILVSLAAGAVIEFVVGFFKERVIMWPASGLLTGNSTAIILRVPGTFHGQWWSTHGIWIFVGVVAISMASKYLIRWRGRHIFNPSNLGLVLAFITLGPPYTEPQDLWWIPLGPWMYVTYAVLIVGGLLIGWELKLLGLEIGYMAAFAASAAVALLAVPDHCMVASWHATAMCGRDLWQILVTSPEVLLFAFFMVPDPRTVPGAQVGRLAFGLLVGVLSVLLLGPTTLEFWTKTAILASLLYACAGRFALARLVAPLEKAQRSLAGVGRRVWTAAGVVALVALLMATLPVSAQLSTHAPAPAPELPDGSVPKLALTVGAGPAVGAWLISNAGSTLPPPSNSTPVSASAHIWVLPTIPSVSIPANVMAFDSSMSQQRADSWAHDVVLDLLIESEARRAHDMKLAEDGASGDGLTEFTDVIGQDIAAGRQIQKTYSFDSVQLTLFLPKFATQAPRLVGVSLHGTTTLITLDPSGAVLAQQTLPYDKSWGIGTVEGGTLDHAVIINDFTDLKPA